MQMVSRPVRATSEPRADALLPFGNDMRRSGNNGKNVWRSTTGSNGPSRSAQLAAAIGFAVVRRGAGTRRWAVGIGFAPVCGDEASGVGAGVRRAWGPSSATVLTAELGVLRRGHHLSLRYISAKFSFMSNPLSRAVTPADAIAVLRRHWRRWLIPAVAVTALGAVYAVLKAPMWEATQALVVRDEAMGATVRPGKFQQPDDMKAAQETVLELARSRAVLRAALAEVGPGANHESDSPWPSAEAIAALAGCVKLTPPKGAEFGKTEVFYLSVKADSPTRALQLTEAICQQLQRRSQELRDQKAQGLVAELTKTVEIAKADLDVTTSSLKEIESEVGSDLGELRVLEDVGGGDSPLRRSISDMETELRQARQSIDGNQELLSLLEGVEGRYAVAAGCSESLVRSPSRFAAAERRHGRRSTTHGAA
jgi:hypothetical protein